MSNVDCVGYWDSCSAECGNGTQKFTIITPKQGRGKSCIATDGYTIPCKKKECPIDCSGNWSACSATCGPGTQTFDEKVPSQYDGKSCEQIYGNLQDKYCKIKECPINCYGGWTGCSEPCGPGTQNFVEKVPSQYGGDTCKKIYGASKGDIRPCIGLRCPIDCSGGWSACSATCGPGEQRFDEYFASQYGGLSCQQIYGASDGNKRTCVGSECPIDCSGNWSACSAKCGPGEQRFDEYFASQYGGLSCQQIYGASDGNKRTCVGSECPINCYGGWTGCSEPCGPGTQNFVEKVPSQYGGDTCKKIYGASKGDIRPCIGLRCPIDCSGGWSACSAKCGPGEQRFDEKFPNQYGGLSCQQIHGASDGNKRACVGSECPIDCYGEWLPCDKECGQGVKKFNKIIPSQYDGKSCEQIYGDLTDKPCKKKECPIDCLGEFGPCNKECGPGVQKFQEKIPSQYGGLSCEKIYGDLTDKPCKDKECPIDCYGEWLPCDKECGQGVKKFNKIIPSQYDGKSCERNYGNLQDKPCNNGVCATCNKACNQGYTLTNGKCMKNCESGFTVNNNNPTLCKANSSNFVNKVNNACPQGYEPRVNHTNCQRNNGYSREFYIPDTFLSDRRTC